MEHSTIQITGNFISDFQIFVENQAIAPGSRYQSAVLEEEKDYGTGKTAGGVEVVLLILSIAHDLTKDLFKDYLKDVLKRKVHSMKYKIKNDLGEELEITLNGLTIKEVEEKVNSFSGNITEINAA